MLFLALVTVGAYFRLESLSLGVIILAALAHVTVFQRAAHFYKKTMKR
jgi:hypothetical protein